MNKKKRALISVWDKSKLIDLALFLVENNFEIISTGGTQKYLNDNNIEVTPVENITLTKHVMNGRVKTLHPKIFGGILADRNNPDHLNDLEYIESGLIDLVIINLYPFKNEAIDKNLSLDSAIEFIDIGGPSMLRAAAKNFNFVIPIADTKDYSKFINLYKQFEGEIPYTERVNFATKIFQITNNYDKIIFDYFNKDQCENIQLNLTKTTNLRYGENPHQQSSFFLPNEDTGLLWNQISGKELSYNNYFDIETAISIVFNFNEIACSIIKHSNPCGFGIDKNPKKAYLKAVSCDKTSYFGGIVGFNVNVDEDAAKEINKSFLECIIAPSFSKKAIEALSKKKNLRLITMNKDIFFDSKNLSLKSVFNGYIIQQKDNKNDDYKTFDVVSKNKPNNEQLKALYLSWNLVKYVKSNAIVFSNDSQILGVGAGQMSRVDSVKIAISKSKENKLNLNNAVMASDAFFPFSDCIEIAYEAGIRGVIQPGGSIKDQEVIDKINELDMYMLFTKKRHFLH